MFLHSCCNKAKVKPTDQSNLQLNYMKRIYFLTTLFLIQLGMANAQNNPLFGTFNTPHETAPFDQIKNEHYMPAFEEGIRLGEAEIEAIKNNPEAPTFENTIAALDRVGEMLNRTSGIFFNLLSSETNDEMQDIKCHQN